jgi:amidase
VKDTIQSRRTFLQISAGASAAVPLLGLSGRALARPAGFDPSFGSACEAMQALETRLISSRELTAHVFARIRQHNPSLNCFVTLLEEQAMQQASEADEARARGKVLGLLHGLPVLMKDVFLTRGVRTTSGSPRYQDYVPTEDAVVVERMKGQGAILVGKTNLPEDAGDWQSFNAVAGQSNNPWDLTRTPGGSTGGGAAALASGLGFLETGSDFAGSIRIPSHFCGVYGHKPSLDLVPTVGHVPPAPGQPWTNPIVVAGPLARSADDLTLGLRVLGGPADQPALRFELPRPRKTRLRDYRIGYVLDDPFAPVDGAVKEVLAGAITALRSAGATLVEGFPEGVSLATTYDLYWYITGGITPTAAQRAQFEVLVREGRTTDPMMIGAVASHYDYALRDQQRLLERARWQRYFQQFDAFLMPPHILPAFPHDPSLPRNERQLQTSTGPRPYRDNTKWISIASLTGLPATSAPVGLSKRGLPVGIQIMGPYYEDGTPIDIARQLTELTGGFQAPPAYAGLH